MELTEDIAEHFARIALGHVTREFPNKLDHVMTGEGDVRGPRDLHPAFFGSYDWHSCVHSWWMLLSLRRLMPQIAAAGDIDNLAEDILSADNLAAELEYIERPSSRGFERPYGWGWLLALHAEAVRHGEREWGERLYPLARAFAARWKAYLPLLEYPITVGTHGNTAFALVHSFDWAKTHDPGLTRMIAKWARQSFANKANYGGWEPAGDEFLSPVLAAALLMSRVMPAQEFTGWFDRLVIENGWLEKNCSPVTVSDRSDGKIAHLDGLNLSRAWCLREIGSAIGDQCHSDLISKRVKLHLDASMPHVAGDYMGEHWLASFALLALLAGTKSLTDR